MRIAVYGASGYTGKLVVAEARRRGLDVVVAGRNAARLRVAAAEVDAAGVEVRAAAHDDPAALAAAFDGCAGVVNCAGPFTALGEPVVRAAIAAGCHYVDTTGEQRYLQRIFATCTDAAEAAGVAVVPAMGFDIVPGDVIAHLTGRAVEPVERLTLGYSISDFVMTRGTMHSALETVLGGDLAFTGGTWQPAGRLRATAPLRFPGREKPAPTMRFPGCEVVTVPRHVKAQNVEVLMDAGSFVPGPLARVATALLPVTEAVLRTRVRGWLDAGIDRLREGPKEERRRRSRYTIVAEATGTDGRTARGEIHGDDIYGITATLCVEGIRRLCAGGAPAGVLAPAQAYDIDDFLAFLGSVGIRWSVA